MKAIINVNKDSSYSKYNGLEFNIDMTKVIEVKGQLVFPIKILDGTYPVKTVDFLYKELIFKSK